MGPFWSPHDDGRWAWLLGQAAVLGQTLVSQTTPRLEMTQIFADLATAAAYAMIPLLILYFFLRRQRVQFSWVWFLLVLYLVVGGAAHVLSAFGESAASWAT